MPESLKHVIECQNPTLFRGISIVEETSKNMSTTFHVKRDKLQFVS